MEKGIQDGQKRFVWVADKRKYRKFIFNGGDNAVKEELKKNNRRK